MIINTTPKSCEDNSRIVSMGGEAPSFGPTRKPVPAKK
jgi:hypothetical protein